MAPISWKHSRSFLRSVILILSVMGLVSCGGGGGNEATEGNTTVATDSDGDGVIDSLDAFPNDATETTDTDGDGVGDNADAFPNDATETTDTNGDGVGDNADVEAEDVDSDGDGVLDSQDAFPDDAAETTDADGDGTGDNADAFPNDAAETTDSDGDGTGDNADAFPNDATETTDTDSDGTGDNSDNCPTEANAGQADTNSDGVGDACSDNDRTVLLQGLSDNIIIPNYEALETSTADFAAVDGPLDQYCSAIGGADEATMLATAQDAWKNTMAIVQETEMHAIGPALDNEGALRDRVHSYSFDTISTCGVDQIAASIDEAGFSVSNRAINQRGFGSVEYLLFNADLGHTCGSQVPTTQGWAALSDNEKKQLRCEAALSIAEDVSSAASSIATGWDTYRTEFTSLGNTGDSMQAVTDALFAIETLAKDQKIGVPTALRNSCSALTCPDRIESPYSENSFTNIRNNLLTFKDMFTGLDGYGFDDFINDEGYPEESAEFAVVVDEAVAIIDATATTLSEQVADITDAAKTAECVNAFSSPDTAAELSACQLNGKMKELTDLLKYEFILIVGVSIPEAAAGDGD